jgi:four helix bundle protein
VQSLRDLKVREKSHRLTLDVYANREVFPRDEMFGLTSQMRRASASEGTSQRAAVGDAERARFLQMAMASASELEYQFLLAHDLEYLHDPAYERLIGQVVEVKKMLSSLMQKVKGVP